VERAWKLRLPPDDTPRPPPPPPPPPSCPIEDEWLEPEERWPRGDELLSASPRSLSLILSPPPDPGANAAPVVPLLKALLACTRPPTPPPTVGTMSAGPAACRELVGVSCWMTWCVRSI
jgi:hypothetical protein